MNEEIIDMILYALKNDAVKKEIVNIIDENKKKPSVKEENSNYEIKENVSEIKEDTVDIEKYINENNEYKEKLNTYINLTNELNEQLVQYKICVEDLKEKNLEYKNKYEKGQKKYTDIAEENSKIKNQYSIINNEYNKLNDELDIYKKTYKNLDDIYNNFLSLRDEIKDNLSNVIKADNSELFLCSGVQWDNLEALWQFISYKLNEYNEDELNMLISTFNYLFEKYNQVQNLYELMNVNIGDEFDEDLHTRGAESRVAGNITKVMLNGYKNIRTNKIIQKSIVRI
ncbi:hypothetical protein [Clostridium sp. SM-530-WT-3G]|uniref:hypothetical protein n=1 Tax=Clostridium sp. SM-530-WT-3G TaxID=2725303 RepID=UPI00145F3065|nr:hypothetical protein [Clostridium sp. SM-530-WT-3G]NME81600.1 hypothetical protein [Clostridium sp. SM-530-WT-3G]